MAPDSLVYDALITGALLAISFIIRQGCLRNFFHRYLWTAGLAPNCTARRPGLENSLVTPSHPCMANALPDPEPLLDFDLKTAKTRDYLYVNKTLRYPYYQTMAHQPMEIENWLEISSEYEWYLFEKRRVIAEHGKKVIDSLPENDMACHELLETVVDWLPKRYPTLFDRLSSSADLDTVTDGILNKVTGETFQWAQGEAPTGVDALRILSRLTECDFLMARERDNGHVYFVGGLVAFPGSYLLSEKIGMSMAGVHEPVPRFRQKLLLSVERTLKNMQPDAPFERSSWAIVDDRNLYWHNIALLQKGAEVAVDPGDLFLRIDRRVDSIIITLSPSDGPEFLETFRKLPRSRGIIFGVHPLLRPLSSLRASPLVPALLHKVLTESDRDMLEYKSALAYERTLIPWLEQCVAQQIDKGLIDGSEKVQNFRSYRIDHTCV